jgi:vacuolar-type H+-ATPase subunit H
MDSEIDKSIESILEAERRAEGIIADANQRAKDIVKNADDECREILRKAREEVEAFSALKYAAAEKEGEKRAAAILEKSRTDAEKQKEIARANADRAADFIIAQTESL